MAKEGGGIKNITQSGSGNAVTDMALSSDGKTITAVFGETFARQQDLGTLNNTVTQLSNKLNNFLEGSDTDNIINKWKELEAFLDGLTESDNLAELLALKADKTITISAGNGLTGGGNLSANRTLSLATTGVKAGTYTKVTVDTYGRVTVGDNPTTLAGYGITDAVTLTTAQTISGRKTFSQNIVFNNNGGITYPDGNVALRNSNGHTILASFGDGSINLRPNGHNNTEGAVWIDKAGNVQAPSVSTNTITIGDAQLVYDSANKALRVKHRTDGNTVGFYSDGWITALGVQTGGAGGGSGVIKTVYSFANLTDGTTFSDSDLDNTFNAYTIKKLYDMVGQGGLDADAMWAELKKADSSKIIDASHIPTSVLDGRWVKKAGDTMTGTLTSASSSGSIVFKGVENCDITNIYKDNGVIRNDDGGLTSIRNGLRFNWYDTYWYIGNLRGSSTDSAGFGVVDHNNKLVLRVTPNDVRAPRFMSTVATGLSPLIVSSNTLVNNLNSNYLEGYNKFGFIHSNYSASTNGAAYVSGDTHIMLIAEIGIDTTYSTYVILLSNEFWGHQHYSALQLHIACTNNDNNGNKTPRCSVNVMSMVGSHARSVYYKVENNKAYIFIKVGGGNQYGRWASTILQNYDSITTNNANTTGNITLRFAFNQANSGLSDASYVNYISSTGLATSRTLWGQSFDGTANVSGNMTGVGSINMSGVLTIKNSTYNKQLIIWSAGSTAKNQGEGILFRCDDATQGVVLRHEWYDTFVPGYGLAVSKHDSLEAGDANMFFYNTGRFIAKAPQGTSPYQCVSTTLNVNLNADLLDGFHAERFLLSVGRSDGTFDLNTYSERAIKEIRTTEQTTNNAPFAGYGLLANLWDSNKFAALQIGGTSADLFFRGKHDGTNKITSAWHRLLHTENYASIADGRYVKKAGDTMTGDLTMNNTKGFNMGWSTRVVKTTGVWIHGGGDAASSTDANLRFGSWYGIGWYPTISGQTVTQGNNAMWLNVRNGNLDTHGAITAHTNYLAANWDSARRLVLGGGSSYAYIDSRNSSNNVLCNIVLEDNKVFIGNYVESSRFVSTVGTGTQPYQCSSTTLNSNLNADMLDNWHLNFLPRNYNIGRCYAVRFALGGEDNGWKKIFACSESGTGPYKSVTVWGRIWYAYGNHAQSEVWNYHFCAIFYMRSGPSSSDSSVGTVENSARLYLPTFAKGMDNIRLVRVGTNNFELQVRQIGSYHNANIEYQYLYYGCNVSAWENLQSTSNTSVAVSAGGASTLADSRASSADVWTTARTFYIQDHNASHTGAGVSVNGSANVYLKLPNSIQCSGWFRSTGNSGWYHQDYGGGIYMQDSAWVRVFGGKRFYVENGDNTDFNAATAISTEGGIYARKNITSSANIIANGAVTAKASSSDIRLKTDIQGYDAMGIIRKFRSVKYHWNAIAKENSEVFNHDNWNYGLIAQDLLSGGYSQWVKDAFNDYYTIDYERLIPVVWKGLQEVDDEVTRLKKRVKELEKRLGINN
jgi:hypothetical protein